MFDYTHISHLPENNITTMENHNFQQVHHETKRATTSSSQSVSVPIMYTGQQHPYHMAMNQDSGTLATPKFRWFLDLYSRHTGMG